ncbi:MAG: HIT domain-containing protein [Alphaproteobacteria bacterium]|nr:HIT domain-containing protein [Alphaproteobacteria bacterium]
MPVSDFTLDHRLQGDTAFVKDLGLCRVLLMDDARFPWLILVPRIEGAVEWFALSPAEQAQTLSEVSASAAMLKRVTGADKINIGALGNVVPQLHIHVVARRVGDAAWPGPVWGVAGRTLHDRKELANLATALAQELPD